MNLPSICQVCLMTRRKLSKVYLTTYQYYLHCIFTDVSFDLIKC